MTDRLMSCQPAAAYVTHMREASVGVQHRRLDLEARHVRTANVLTHLCVVPVAAAAPRPYPTCSCVDTVHVHVLGPGMQHQCRLQGLLRKHMHACTMVVLLAGWRSVSGSSRRVPRSYEPAPQVVVALARLLNEVSCFWVLSLNFLSLNMFYFLNKV